jgi:hypothetical protein
MNKARLEELRRRAWEELGDRDALIESFDLAACDLPPWIAPGVRHALDYWATHEPTTPKGGRHAPWEKKRDKLTDYLAYTFTAGHIYSRGRTWEDAYNFAAEWHNVTAATIKNARAQIRRRVRAGEPIIYSDGDPMSGGHLTAAIDYAVLCKALPVTDEQIAQYNALLRQYPARRHRDVSDDALTSPLRVLVPLRNPT